MFGFSPVLMWTLRNGAGLSLALSFLVALAVAAAIGYVNGWFVTRLKIPSFLVTLGMLLVVRGTALFVTNGFPQRTWSAGGDWLAQALAGEFFIGTFRVYSSLFWFVGAALALGFVLTQTKIGNWIQAAGGNAGAARRGASTSIAPRSGCSCCRRPWRRWPGSSVPSAPRPPTPTAAPATSWR